MAHEHPSIQNSASRSAHLLFRLRALSNVACHNSADLVVVIALTIAGMICILAGGNMIARTVFALPLVLVLPGYALVAATCSRLALGNAERLLMILGVSVSITILAGLALNSTSWGLTRITWCILLGSVTLGSSIIALLMRARLHDQARRTFGFPRINFSARQWLLAGLAVATLVGAVVLAHNGVAQQPSEGFTQLWIQPVSTGQQMQIVRIGVKNMQSINETYSLSVTEGGKELTRTLLELKPGQEWDMTATLPIRQQANMPVEASLYQAGAPRIVYRHVVLWINK